MINKTELNSWWFTVLLPDPVIGNGTREHPSRAVVMLNPVDIRIGNWSNQYSPEVDLFKQRLRNSLLLQTRDSRTIKIARHSSVYTCGDRDELVYFIESGQIKLLALSPEGKECLLAIYTSGDVFGELSFCRLGARQETAIAMEKTILKLIPCSKFFRRLTTDALVEGFVRYLTVRISDQQEAISNLLMVDSEQRLGKTLLQLARKLGKKDSRSIRIEHKISHEELSQMVGTTRPRISEFMRRFRELNLIELSSDHFIIVQEQKLADYLRQIA